MNLLDIAITLIILLSCVFGLWRGLIKEVLSLVTWIAALLLAKTYAGILASSVFTNVIDNSSIRYVVAFAIIFILVMMLGTFLNFLMSKVLAVTGLKFADRLLGGVFGISRGLLIVLIGLFLSGIFISETQQWQQSLLIPYGLEAIEWSRIFMADIDELGIIL
jgi:membrane protein required for colicin V production